MERCRSFPFRWSAGEGQGPTEVLPHTRGRCRSRPRVPLPGFKVLPAKTLASRMRAVALPPSPFCAVLDQRFTPTSLPQWERLAKTLLQIATRHNHTRRKKKEAT